MGHPRTQLLDNIFERRLVYMVGRTFTMTSNNKFNVQMPTYAQASSVFLPPLLASPLKMLSRTRVLVQAFAALARARTGEDLLR